MIKAISYVMVFIIFLGLPFNFSSTVNQFGWIMDKVDGVVSSVQGLTGTDAFNNPVNSNQLAGDTITLEGVTYSYKDILLKIIKKSNPDIMFSSDKYNTFVSAVNPKVYDLGQYLAFRVTLYSDSKKEGLGDVSKDCLIVSSNFVADEYNYNLNDYDDNFPIYHFKGTFIATQLSYDVYTNIFIYDDDLTLRPVPDATYLRWDNESIQAVWNRVKYDGTLKSTDDITLADYIEFVYYHYDWS